jgi:hypothetical protein
MLQVVPVWVAEKEAMQRELRKSKGKKKSRRK